MSINDILKMDIVNGKLVDPEEEAALQDESSIEDAEETQEKETTEEITEEEPANPEASITDTEMINPDMPLTGDGETQALNAEEFSITDMLNEFFEAEAFRAVIDTDENGELNEEEITTFLSAISGLDGEEENISLEDILNAAEAINEGEFSLAAEEEILSEEPEITEEVKPSTSSKGSSGVSGVSRNFGGSGSSGISGTYSPQGVEEKTLDNMSKEELNSELSTAQSDLSDKQSALSAILDGSDPQMQELQQNIDKAYKTYHKELEKVDKDMAAQVDELKQNIEAKEAEIDAKEQEISDQEGVVSDCETSYKDAVSSKSSLESALSALDSMKTDENASEIEEKKANIQAAIDALKIDEKKQAWEEAQDKLDTLNDEKEELISGEGGLNELNEQMTELEAQIADKYPAIQEYMDAYNNAKEEYNTAKVTAITNAKADVTEAQNYVNEVQTAINNYDTNQTIRENRLDLQAAVDWARQYDDYSQSEIQQIFADLGYQFDYNAWCADFVRMALGEAIGDENLPEWYQNCPNKAYCPTIQQYGEGHQISAEEAKPGDIVLYDWDGDGVADHVGLFVDNGDGSSTITAIEGNTSGEGGGSCVEEKSRDRGSILGIYSMS